MNSTLQVRGSACFPNQPTILSLSILWFEFFQALASLTYLQPHLDAIIAKAEALDVPTPVIDALQDLFQRKSPLVSSLFPRMLINLQV